VIDDVGWNEALGRSYEKFANDCREWLRKPLIPVVFQKGLIVRQDKGLGIQCIVVLRKIKMNIGYKTIILGENDFSSSSLSHIRTMLNRKKKVLFEL